MFPLGDDVGDTDTRLEDGAHVGGLEATELDGASERRHQGVATPGRFEGGDGAELAGQLGGAGGGGVADEGFADRTEGEEGPLGSRAGPKRPGRASAGTAVVLVDEATSPGATSGWWATTAPWCSTTTWPSAAITVTSRPTSSRGTE